MWTRAYWKKQVEDAIAYGATTAVTYLGADAVNVLQVEWTTLGGLVLGSMLVAVLKGLAVKNVGSENSPRVVE